MIDHRAYGDRIWLIGSTIGIPRYAHALTPEWNDTLRLVGSLPFLIVLEVVFWRRLAKGWRLPSAVVLGLWCGASWGNGFERVDHGFVTDWIYIELPSAHPAATNVADLALLGAYGGGLALLLLAAIGRMHRRRLKSFATTRLATGDAP